MSAVSLGSGRAHVLAWTIHESCTSSSSSSSSPPAQHHGLLMAAARHLLVTPFLSTLNLRLIQLRMPMSNCKLCLDDVAFRRSMLVNGWDHGALLSFYHKVLEETSQACSGYQKAWVAFHAAQSLFQTGATCLEIEDPRGGLRFFAAAQSSLIITQQARILSMHSPHPPSPMRQGAWVRAQGALRPALPVLGSPFSCQHAF